MLSQGSCQALKQIDPWWAPPGSLPTIHRCVRIQRWSESSGLGRHSCSLVLYIQQPVGNVFRIRKNSHDLVSRAIFCSCSPRHFWLNAATHSTHTRSGSHLEFKSIHRFQQSKRGGSLSGYTKDINIHICLRGVEPFWWSFWLKSHWRKSMPVIFSPSSNPAGFGSGPGSALNTIYSVQKWVFRRSTNKGTISTFFSAFRWQRLGPHECSARKWDHGDAMNPESAFAPWSTQPISYDAQIWSSWTKD